MHMYVYVKMEKLNREDKSVPSSPVSDTRTSEVARYIHTNMRSFQMMAHDGWHYKTNNNK
jgi:hypothetical protein